MMALTISCSSSPKEIQIKTEPVDTIQIIQPERPAPPLPVEVDLRVLTSEVLYNEFYRPLISKFLENEYGQSDKNDIIGKIDDAVYTSNESYAYYAFDEKSYLNFSQWLEMVYSYTQEYKVIVNYYEDLTSEFKDKEDKENEK